MSNVTVSILSKSTGKGGGGGGGGNSGTNPSLLPSNQTGRNNPTAKISGEDVSFVANNMAYKIRVFDSLYSSRSFTAAQTAKLNAHNKSIYDNEFNRPLQSESTLLDWFGFPAPKNTKELDNYTNSLRMNDYKNLKATYFSKLKKLLRNPKMTSVKTKKIAFNSLGLGNFSFDRAAVGLTKRKQPDGTLKVVSTVSECYAYHVNKSPVKTVRLFNVIGAAGTVDANRFIYNGASLAFMQEMLEQKGYSVEIYIIVGSLTEKNALANFIKVKPFNKPLKLNDCILLAGDAKYFRWQAFKDIIGMYHYWGLKCPKSFGFSLSNNTHIAKRMIDNLFKGDVNYLVPSSFSESQMNDELLDFLSKI